MNDKRWLKVIRYAPLYRMKADWNLGLPKAPCSRLVAAGYATVKQDKHGILVTITQEGIDVLEKNSTEPL